MEGIKNIKERYNLHSTPEVQSAVRREEISSDEKVPQKPLTQIQVYFDRFKEITEREDPKERERGMKALKEILYRDNVIDAEDVPDSYFELQKRIAREAGEEFVLSEPKRAELTELVQEDQKESLDRWIDCLAGPDEYPDWAKYWIARSVLAMGPYDVQKHEYSKRSKGTTKGYPELNEEALGIVVEILKDKLSGAEVENPVKAVPNPHNPNEEKKFTDEQFAKLLTTENFAKYYAFAIEHAVSDNSELFPITEGEWKTFPQGSEPDELCALLQGQGTGWCTAGKSMAKSQLDKGPFSVYCSKNALGEAVIPRAAIRTTEHGIAEVRGVEAGQEMDSYITEVVREKMSEFGEDGEIYKEKADNIDSLNSIELKTETQQPLDMQELRFLYELDKNIDTFGNYKNPKIKELLSRRIIAKDLRSVYDAESDTEVAERLYEDGRIKLFLDNLGEFSGVSEGVAQRLIEDGDVSKVLNNLESFEPIDLERVEASLVQNRKWQIIAHNIETFPNALANQETLEAFADDEPELLLRNLIGIKKVVPDFDSEAISEAIMGRWIESDDTIKVFQNVGYIDKAKQSAIIEEIIHDENVLPQLASGLRSIKHLSEVVADRLLEHSYGAHVANSLSSFKNISVETAVALVEQGFGDNIVSYVERVDPARHNEVLSALIDSQQLKSFASQYRAWSFKNIGSDNLLRLVEIGQPKIAAELINYHNVELGSVSGTVAEGLIDADLASTVAGRIEEFTPTDHRKIASKLLESGNEETLLRNLDVFTGVDEQVLAEFLLTEEKDELLANHLGRFKKLEGSVATHLVEAGFGYKVAENIRKFEPVDYQELADTFISYGEFAGLAHGVDGFKDLNTETALALIEAKQIIGYPNLDPFENADLKQIADALIKIDKPWLVQQNLATFKEKLAPNELGKVIIDAGLVNSLVESDSLNSEELVDYYVLSDTDQRLLSSFEEFMTDDMGEILNMDQAELKKSIEGSTDELDDVVRYLSNTCTFLESVIKKIETGDTMTDSVQRYKTIKEKLVKISEILGQPRIEIAA